MKKLGIVSKLTLWYSFIMVVIASLMIGFLLYVVRRVTIDSVQKKLVDTITKASKEIEYEENISEEDDIYIEYGDAYIEIDEDYIKERNGVYIALYNLESDLLYGSLPPLDNIEKLPAFSEEIKEVEEEGLRYYIYDMPVKDKRLKRYFKNFSNSGLYFAYIGFDICTYGLYDGKRCLKTYRKYKGVGT